MNLLEKITENLDTVFRGDAWHGPSVMEILNSIPTEKVAQKHQLSKQTITQHVYHLTAWRKFALEKLNDNIHYSVETEDDNWGKDSETTPECFPKLVEDLKKYHGLLLDELEGIDHLAECLLPVFCNRHHGKNTGLKAVLKHERCSSPLLQVKGNA